MRKSQNNETMPPYLDGSQASMVNGQIDLSLLFSILWRFKWRLLLSAIVTSLIFCVYSLTQEDIFESSIVMMHTSDAEGESKIGEKLGGLGSLIGIGGNGGEKQKALAILKSRTFIGSFIKEEGIAPKMFLGYWDSEKNTWKNAREKCYLVIFCKDIISEEITNTTMKPSEERVFKKFNDSLVIKEDRVSGLITLSIKWGNPVLATIWSNKIVEEVNEYLKAQAVEEADKSIDYLTKQLGKTDVMAMQNILYSLVESQIQKRMLASIRSEYAFKVIDMAQIPEYKVKPARSMITLVGFFIGILIGMVHVLFKKR